MKPNDSTQLYEPMRCTTLFCADAAGSGATSQLSQPLCSWVSHNETQSQSQNPAWTLTNVYVTLAVTLRCIQVNSSRAFASVSMDFGPTTSIAETVGCSDCLRSICSVKIWEIFNIWCVNACINHENVAGAQPMKSYISNHGFHDQTLWSHGDRSLRNEVWKKWQRWSMNLERLHLCFCGQQWCVANKWAS